MAVACYFLSSVLYVYVCTCVCLHVGEQWHRAEERLVYGVESNSTLLECVPRSLQARVLWFFQTGDEKLEVSLGTLTQENTIQRIQSTCM